MKGNNVLKKKHGRIEKADRGSENFCLSTPVNSFFYRVSASFDHESRDYTGALCGCPGHLQQGNAVSRGAC